MCVKLFEINIFIKMIFSRLNQIFKDISLVPPSNLNAHIQISVTWYKNVTDCYSNIFTQASMIPWNTHTHKSGYGSSVVFSKHLKNVSCFNFSNLDMIPQLKFQEIKQLLN